MKPIASILSLLLLLCSCRRKMTEVTESINTPVNVDTVKPTVIDTTRHRGHYYKHDYTNTLDGKEQTLELEYMVMGCNCAPWIEIDAAAKYPDSLVRDHYMFLEAADSSVELSKSFDPFKDIVRVKGLFYVRMDYPKDVDKYGHEEHLRKALLFRYTELKMMTKTEAVSRDRY